MGLAVTLVPEVEAPVVAAPLVAEELPEVLTGALKPLTASPPTMAASPTLKPVFPPSA